MALYQVVAPRVEGLNGWRATVEVAGVKYLVGVVPGQRVRIAFKPRGENYGFHWYGFVRELDKPYRELLGHSHGRVGKSIGIRGLLTLGGILERDWLRQDEALALAKDLRAELGMRHRLPDPNWPGTEDFYIRIEGPKDLGPFDLGMVPAPA